MKYTKTGAFMLMLAAMMTAVSATVSLSVAAAPVANEIDLANPMGNMWVVGAVIAFTLGLVLMFVGFVQKTESQKMYAYGFISIVLALLFVLLAMFVPAVPEITEGGGDVSATTYSLILNPANDTTLGYNYETYYKWKSVNVNTTSNLIENYTGMLTFNVTMSRTAGATNDVVTCYISAADIPTSDNDYSIIAKTSGQFAITWTDDAGAAVTGLNKLAIAFPGDGVRTHYATCAVTLNDVAWNDLADAGASGSQFKLTFVSQSAGVIGTVPIDIDLTYF